MEHRPEDDDSANTEMFQAFVDRPDEQRGRAVGAPFRLLTLLVGLVVFAGIVWLLLQ
jgi:hypothetical protein